MKQLAIKRKKKEKKMRKSTVKYEWLVFKAQGLRAKIFKVFQGSHTEGLIIGRKIDWWVHGKQEKTRIN